MEITFGPLDAEPASLNPKTHSVHVLLINVAILK